MNNPIVEKPPEKIQLSVELPNNLYDLLTAQANLQSRTISDLLEEAVREFVSDQ